VSERETTCVACGRRFRRLRGTGRPRLCCSGCIPVRASHREYLTSWRRANRTSVELSNVARRIRYEPRTCPACGLVFTPVRRDSRFCCPRCSLQARRYGRWTPEGAAWHIAQAHAGASNARLGIDDRGDPVQGEPP
jgi:hypothetical protein